MRSTNIIYTQITIPRLNPAFSLSLCVYVESILRIHIYEQIHLETTNKPRFPPPAPPPLDIHFEAQSFPTHPRVLIFVLCPIYLFFPFYPEKSADLRGWKRRRVERGGGAATLPSHRHYRPAYLVTRFHSFIYRTEISLISIVRTALMRCLVIHRF